MEAAAVSAATGALKPVLGKLRALLGDEYKRFKGVRKDIKALKYELVAMDAFLMNMSEEEDPDVQERAWMNEVRELSYFLEDCIDDFMQSVGDNDAKPDESFMERIKRSLGKLGKMKARRRIGNEIHDLKKQIIEVAERNQRYKTREPFSSTKNATIDTRALAMFEDASKLVGIDEPKAEIIKLLTQQDGRASPQQHPKLVSIVGSGGMGKTTLANQVYQELRGQFECHAFLPVSRNPDMKNILRTILSEVSGQDYAATEAGSREQLITKIKDFLADKRYFVVVDDIWDVAAWDIIKPAFPMTSSGSIIITTTRINDVAKSCRSSFGGDIYGIRPLNMVHSTQLFHRRLFDSKEDLPSHLEKVSDQILQKCDGLPLAIITISGLLANRERTEDLWNQVKDSIGRALERDHGVKRMMKILSLSYFDLPPHLKSCLLYMSIFPEDSIIKRKALIRRWIGEGFIHKEGRYSVYEIGERCFNELLNRGLIQPGETDGCDEMTSCRVHDTILDFIISKSIEENFVALLGVPNLPIGTQSKVARRLSLQDVKQGNSTISTAGLVLSHVRSLNVFGHSIEIPCMEEFTHLHVLDLKRCDRVKDHHLENIVKLFQLRYLNLRRTGIRKLPEQIGNLGCLEMLNIRHTMVEELPASIVDLRKLSHLLVDFKVKFPDGIAKMQALEMLKEVMASKQSLDFLSGLGQLKSLRNLVLVEWAGTDMDGVEEECTKAIVSSLCLLGTQNLLRSLTIQNWGGLLQEPLSLLTLEKLIVLWTSVPQVPEWIRSLRNLQQLNLSVNLLQVDCLCILGSLPTLLILNLNAYSGKKGSFRISGEIGFRCLRKFSFHANNCDFGVTFPAGSMPKLEILHIFDLLICEAESLDVGIKNLPFLSYVLFDCLVHGDDQKEAVKASMERAVSRHPKHPSLVFGCRS